MEYTRRILTVLSGSFAVLLVVCLILSIASVVMLSRGERQALADAQRMEAEIEALVKRVERMEGAIAADSAQETEETVEVAANALTVYLRDVEGKIGVFSEDGNCICKTDYDTALLPRAEQDALTQGVLVTSLCELLALKRDYGL